MPPERSLEQSSVASAQCFLTTHWSVVVAAREGASVEADAALERLCRLYWWPLYAFVRRRGYGAHDAQDLTQEFFARLLAKDFLRAVDRSKGKFRSFLLAALEHFLAKEWRRANAQKRGSKFSFVSIDDHSAEQPYLQVPASNLSPEQLFEQQWAIALLEQAVAKLREEFLTAGKQTLFEELKIFLTGRKGCLPPGGGGRGKKQGRGQKKGGGGGRPQGGGGLGGNEIANTGPGRGWVGGLGVVCGGGWWVGVFLPGGVGSECSEGS